MALVGDYIQLEWDTKLIEVRRWKPAEPDGARFEVVWSTATAGIGKILTVKLLPPGVLAVIVKPAIIDEAAVHRHAPVAERDRNVKEEDADMRDLEEADEAQEDEEEEDDEETPGALLHFFRLHGQTSLQVATFEMPADDSYAPRFKCKDPCKDCKCKKCAARTHCVDSGNLVPGEDGVVAIFVGGPTVSAEEPAPAASLLSSQYPSLSSVAPSHIPTRQRSLRSGCGTRSRAIVRRHLGVSLGGSSSAQRCWH